MTDNKEIERLAKEAGMCLHDLEPDQLAKLVALVAEECAKHCEAQNTFDYDDPASGYAAAIRSKFPMPKG